MSKRSNIPNGVEKTVKETAEEPSMTTVNLSNTHTLY